MHEALIVADDLTGAADTAAAFASRGMKSIVSWTVDAPECEVLAIDTETRTKSPQEAVFAVGSSVSGFAGLLYKRIDSQLRGNVGAEITAALRASKRDAVILAPAHPAIGWTTVGGKQLSGDKPLPIDLVSMLVAEGLRVSPVNLAEVRSGKVVRGRADVYLFDAETDEDLERIAEATAGLHAVYAGSGGFVRHLPMLTERAPHACPAIKIKKHVVTVTGSASAVAQEQMLQVPDSAVPLVLTPTGLRKAQPMQIMAEAYKRCIGFRDVWLTLFVQKGGAEDPQTACRLAEFVAEQADAIGGLISNGGDTTRALFRAFGVQSAEVLGEVEPGVPLLRTDTGLPVITKAGSFGDLEILARLRRAFQ